MKLLRKIFGRSDYEQKYDDLVIEHLKLQDECIHWVNESKKWIDQNTNEKIKNVSLSLTVMQLESKLSVLEMDKLKNKNDENK